MKIKFHKYQGTGNDFVIIDNRDGKFEADKEIIKNLCVRRFGIGADGLMLLENARGVDFKMVYYNSDGKESTMCGNGGRCIAAYALDREIAPFKGTFLAIDGEHEYEVGAHGVKLKMIDVDVWEENNGHFILNTGSPHYVEFAEKVMTMPLIEEARKIRYNERFSEQGINVNFVEDLQDSLILRTYERGVEDETLSCGTGTVATAIAYAIRNALTIGPLKIFTKGGELKVLFEKDNLRFKNIWLQGPAISVYEGIVNLEALPK
jgi:diaminopimelate epimerase